MEVKKFENFSEGEQINWRKIEKDWNKWYEDSFGEADYDDEFDALKNIFSENTKVSVDWKKVRSQYYKYIERTSNEDDYDDKFRNFKNIINNL